jgi:hypothetical protein
MDADEHRRRRRHSKGSNSNGESRRRIGRNGRKRGRGSEPRDENRHRVRRERNGGGFGRRNGRLGGDPAPRRLAFAALGEQPDDPDHLGFGLRAAALRAGLRAARFHGRESNGFRRLRAAAGGRLPVGVGAAAAGAPAAGSLRRRRHDRGKANQRDELGAGEQDRHEGTARKPGKARSAHRMRCGAGCASGASYGRRKRIKWPARGFRARRRARRSRRAP